MAQHPSSATAEEILARIREEAARQTLPEAPSGTADHVPGNTLAGIPLKLPGITPPPPPRERKPVRHVTDLLQLHDREFIQAAYQFFLQRMPDGPGSDHFLGRLRRGRMTKAEILARLRFSPEGRSRKVPVKGMIPVVIQAMAARIPVLGWLGTRLCFWADLPGMVRRLEQTEVRTAAEKKERDRLMARWAALLEETARDTLSRKAFDPLWTDLTHQVHQLREAQQQTAGQLEQARIQDLRRSVLAQELQMARLLDQAREALTGPLPETRPAVMVSEEVHRLDALYASFEERFRGTRHDIKDRQQVYLPYLEAVGAGTPEAPVLDLGCGRGEWLELLAEHDKTASGVDLNRIFVTECRDRGLAVTVRDLLDHLRDLPDDCLGAVTAFHLIEHLPLNTLVTMLDETLRVLKPGGIAVFETPNPENLMVGACTFYTDPTHHNPLPPDSTRFLMTARGFSECDILRLHPYDKPPQDMKDTLPPSLGQLLYGEQDYAVIGHKAGT
jgi:O-antigen chain-terminating methyltransferase